MVLAPHILDSDGLLYAFQTQKAWCLKQRTHVWAIGEDSVVKFLNEAEAQDYCVNAAISRALGLRTVDACVVPVTQEVYGHYIQDYDDDKIIQQNPAALVMSRAKGVSLDRYRKTHKNSYTALCTSIGTDLYVGGLLGMMPDLNDTNIFVQDDGHTTLIDFGEGMANITPLSLEEQMSQYECPSRFPHFQIDIDPDAAIAVAERMVTCLDNIKDMAVEPYKPVIKRRHRDLVKIINSL